MVFPQTGAQSDSAEGTINLSSNGSGVVVSYPFSLSGDSFFEVLAEIYMLNNPISTTRTLSFEIFLDGNSLKTSFGTLAAFSDSISIVREVLSSPYGAVILGVHGVAPSLISVGQHIFDVRITISGAEGAFTDTILAKLYVRITPKVG